MNNVMIVSDEDNTKSGLLFIGKPTGHPMDTAEPKDWFHPLSPLVPPACLTESCTNITQSNSIFSRSHKVNFEIFEYESEQNKTCLLHKCFLEKTCVMQVMM